MLVFVNWYFLFIFAFLANGIEAPRQPASGPGGSDYLHETVTIFDNSEKADGYWLYEPQNPRPDSAHLVVFLHGYGAINPMIYGSWIHHLVRKGNIVLFPRYQKSLLSPGSEDFVPNVAIAIKNAIHELDSGDHVRPILDKIALVGHSYGGTIAANLAVHSDSLGIPKPVAVMLCSPGTGPLKGGLLDNYIDMPANLNLLVLVSEHDKVVGDKLGIKIFETAVNTSRRNLIRQYADTHGEPAVSAEHNESYCLYEAFDCGLDNLSSRRAKRISTEDAMDYYGYWKLMDALLACSRDGMYCDYAFGDTPAQRFMGVWSDGQPVKELEVILPETETKEEMGMGN